MTNLILALILLILAGFAGVLFALILVLRSYIRRFSSFLTSADEKTPSDFAQLVDTVGHSLGHAAAMEIKTTLMGYASGKSRLAEAVASEVVHEAQPGLAGILDAIPRGSRRKNAGLFEILLEKFGPSLIGGFAGGTGGTSNRPGSNGDAPKFKLGV